MTKAVSRKVHYKYDWCQYMDDVEHGLFTVKEVRTTDIMKVYSQNEALGMVNKLNHEAEEKERSK